MNTDTSSNSQLQPSPSSPVLLVVESPVKARTIAGFLGEGWIVRSTGGHIADIPESAKAVDVQANFAATYVLSERGAERIAELRTDMARCSAIVLATDGDREGELIAAHVVEFLAPTVPVHRAVFHAVTAEAVTAAIAESRGIDTNLVAAAKTRRIVDRLVGYRMTEVTRRLVRGNTTAGRVQSPALRLVVERELERLAFVPSIHWDVRFESATSPSFEARLVSVDGTPIAGSGDFDAAGVPRDGTVVLGPVRAAEIAEGLGNGWPVTVTAVVDKEASRHPRPPFTMSTLYQEAHSRLGMSVAETRVVSQKLFDSGHITYPRTDNPVHEPASRAAIRAEIAEVFGPDAVHPTHRWTSSSGRTQGAHEAIRPVRLGVRELTGVGRQEARLYDLIWRRTMASQMAAARGITRTVTIRAEDTGTPGSWCGFTTSGTVYTQRGFLMVWGDDGEGSLPALAVDDVVPVASAEAKEHRTQPPARYNDGTLVDALETRGIGRPSTYESIISKLRDRYVFSHGKTGGLIPTVTAYSVHRLLSAAFAPFVEDGFTALMESELDEVEEDAALRDQVLHELYFGFDGESGLSQMVEEVREKVDVRELWSLDLGVHPVLGERMIVRPGMLRGGKARPYVQCGSETMSIDDRTEFTPEFIASLVDALGSQRDRDLGEIDGLPVSVRRNATGAYFQWGDAKNHPAGHAKPVFAPLLESMSPISVTLEDARKMFGLPRVVGAHPELGAEIRANIGRHGAYLECADKRAKLTEETEVFEISLADAIAAIDAAKPARKARPPRKRAK